MAAKKKPPRKNAAPRRRPKSSPPPVTPPPKPNASRARAKPRRAPPPPAAPAAPATPPPALSPAELYERELRKPGRPTKRTRDLEEWLLSWIAHGRTLRSWCRLEGTPSHVTVHEWRKADPEFDARYDFARRIGYELLGEEALDIANTPQVGEVITEESVTVKDADDVEVPATKRTVRTEDMLGHRKLQFEARLKLLKVWFPERYGEKVNVDHKSGGKSFDEILRRALGDDQEQPE